MALNPVSVKATGAYPVDSVWNILSASRPDVLGSPASRSSLNSTSLRGSETISVKSLLGWPVPWCPGRECNC